MFKDLYRKLTLPVLLLLTFIGTQDVLASHLSGGDLFYSYVRGSRGLKYRVTLRLYRDCSGISLTNETINLSAGRCGAAVAGAAGTGSIAVTKRDTQKIFCDRYPRTYLCSSTTDPANPNRPPNYEAVDYVTTITLPSRRNNWCFWWTSGARPDLANVSSVASNVYIDAILNNLDVDSNNSPYFNSIDVPLPFVCVGKPFTYSFNTLEADGDSLSYALTTPLADCSTGVTYNTYAAGIFIDSGQVNPANKNNALVGYWSGGTYSSTFPIPSFSFTRQPNGLARATPFFRFSAQTGALSFIPMFYTPVGVSAGDNKYVVTVRITERRRIPRASGTGFRWVVVGEIERDMLINITDCSGGIPATPVTTVPTNTNGSVTTRADSLSIDIKAQTCTYTKATVLFNDSNVVGNFKVTYQAVNGGIGSLPFSPSVGTFTLVGNNTRKPAGYFKLTPGASEAGKTYSMLVKVENTTSCPLKFYKIFQVDIKIVQSNFGDVYKPGGVSTRKDTICIGDSTQIEARVNRPDTTINGAPITYTYRWDNLPGIRPADTLNQIVTVRPPATFRYKFTAYNSAFPGCYDTASVLVYVRTPVTPVIQAFYPQSKPGFTTEAPVTVRLVNGSYPITDADKTTWYLKRFQRSGDTLALDLDSGIISRQLNPDTLVTLRKPGIYVFRLDVDTRTKSSVRCYASGYDTIVVPEPVYYYPNTFTPNNDGYNDVLTFKTPSNDLALSIYNRYGVVVKKWDQYKNDYAGDDLPAGTYFYYVRDNKSGEVRKQWLEVMR